MDRGLLILLAFAGLLVMSVILEVIGVIKDAPIRAIMAISLIYHTGYTIFCIHEWVTRDRIRNVKRGNLRPPRGGRY